MAPIFIGIGLVILTVLIHHELLYALSSQLQHTAVHPRFRLLLGVTGAMLAHVVEIVLFAGGLYFLISREMYGNLIGEKWEGFGDVIYFSFVTYSSLGYGDIIPEGPLRFMAAMEVLTGMVMIAWTASFLYGLIRVSWKSN